MKLLKIVTLAFAILIGMNTNAQSENSKSDIEQITETLMDYIDGTANGEPERLKKSIPSRF